MNFCGFLQISEPNCHFSSKFLSEPHHIQDYYNIIAVVERSPHSGLKQFLHSLVLLAYQSGEH
jgi:hypothetical protein